MATGAMSFIKEHLMWDRVIRTPEQLRATRRLLAQLPKVELHAHLAASIPERLVREAAEKHGVRFPDPSHPYRFEGGFHEFLLVYEQVVDVFRTPEELARATYESLAAEAARSNLRYREMHYPPALSRHLDYVESVQAIADGIERARRETGVDARIIIAIYRNQGRQAAEQLAADMIAHPHPLVVGLGIEAEGTVAPIEWFHDAYASIREAGYPVTAHAEEHVDAEEALYDLHSLGCRRIDHGYALAGDPDAAAAVREAGVHLAATWIGASDRFGKTPDNPIRTLLEQGLDVSISSDAPGISGISLNEFLEDALVSLQLPDRYLVEQNFSQLDHAWLGDEEKAAIRAEITSALAGAGFDA
ncbi:hypothetical protein [Pseudonocardia ailaonensis]